MEDEFDFLMGKPDEVIEFEKMLDENAGVYFDVDVFEQIIDHYLYENNINKAISAADYALTLHPTSISLKLRIATLLASKNDKNGAMKLIEEIENIEPGNIDIYLAKGAIYSQFKQYEKAIEEYNKALPGADDPDYICCNIAFEYENLGNYSKTIEYLRKALEYNPDNYVAMYEAAYCFDLLSLNEESIAFFQKLIDKHPYSIEAWFNLGVSFINEGLYEKAIDALDYCLAIDEGHKPAHIQKAVAYSNLNEFRQAIDWYKKSIEDNEEDHPMVLYYIGECFEKMEKYEEACTYYNKALEYDPEITDAWFGTGVCELELGNHKKAIEYMLKGLSFDPENTSYLCIIADAYLLCSDKKNCAKYFEKALLFDNADLDTWIDYASAMISFDDINGAIDVVLRGREVMNNPAFNYKMAVCLYLQGKNKEADFFLEEAFNGDPLHSYYRILEKYPELFKIKSLQKLIDVYGP